MASTLFSLCANRRTLFLLSTFTLILLFTVLMNEVSENKLIYITPQFTGDSLVNTDTRWHYDCKNGRCIQTKSNSSSKTSLETCNMMCSMPQLWPQPSKFKFKKSSVSFFPQQLYFQTFANDAVKSYLMDAYSTFSENIYHLSNDQESWKWQTQIKQFIVNVIVAKSSLDLTLVTDETYSISINKSQLDIVANITSETYYGARHGLETLSQLIWWDSFDNTLKVIDEVEIKDGPKFGYRGVMVDTARNYFTIDSLKKVVSGMSANKLNVFHWHITDTQSFPLATNRTEKFSKHGAYQPQQIYTTSEIKEFVEYAKVRGVRVIIEVDAPAHVNRGWNWGPEQGLGPLVVCENSNIMEGQLNPENPAALTLLEQIYKDLLGLNTNNEIFHLGSDEVDENCWRRTVKSLGPGSDVRNYWGNFVKKMIDRLSIANNNTNPKHIVLWSSPLTQPPHLQKYLDKTNVVIQSWLGDIRSIVREGYKMIFSTVGHWYLDCGFGRWRESVGAVCDPYTPWQSFYKYTPWIENNCEKQTLGGEVCLWSEQVEQDSLETRIWPRSAAFAERVWSDPKTFGSISESVYTRLDTQRRRMVGRGLKAEGMWPQLCSLNPGLCH